MRDQVQGQARRRLRVVGTASESSLALAQWLAAAMHASAENVATWDVSISVPGTAIPCAEDQEARWLAFIDGPECALAASQQHAAPSDPADVLQAWRDGARRLLNHAHSVPGRCLVVDADEALFNPDGLATVLSTWLSCHLEALPIDATGRPDALMTMLARALAAPDRRAALLYAELQASCVHLPGQPDPSRVSVSVQATAALDRFRYLAEIERRQPTQDEDRSRLLLSLSEAQLSLEQERELRAANEVRTVAVTGLLANEQLRQKKAEDLLSEVRNQLRSAEQEASQQRTALTAAADEKQRLQGDLARAREETQLLLIQLHQVQHELESLFLREQQAQDELTQLHSDERDRQATVGVQVSGPLSSSAHIRAAGVSITQAGSVGPHRELVTDLEHVDLGDASLPQLTLKLVEHGGRPGIVVMATGGDRQALTQWRPTGQEDGRDLMLLVPQDTTGRQLLETLGASDWKTLLGLAHLLQHTVEQAGAAIAPLWPVVANRLLAQLQALRPRLRYDRVNMCAEDATQTAYDVKLEGLLHGSEALAPVHLHWAPRAAHSRLEWRLDTAASAMPPLTTWPTQSDGSLAPQLAIPIGPGFRQLQKIRWWSALAPVDLDLLLSLMDALPAAVRRMEPPAAGAALNASELVRAARLLRSDARRAVVAGRLGRMARGVIRGRGPAA